jgi:hypothetical protein
MHEAKIALIMEVEARRNAAELLEPREQPLHLPAALLAPQLVPVLQQLESILNK